MRQAPNPVQALYRERKRRQRLYDSMLAVGAVLRDVRGTEVPRQGRRLGNVPLLDLVELMGARGAAALLRTYGGQRLPSYRMLLRFLRIESMRRDWAKGFRQPQLLARKYQLPTKLVRKIIAADLAEEREKTAAALAGLTPDPEPAPLVMRID